MRKIISVILAMFLSVPAFAESWIYVKSDAVEKVINSSMVASEKRENVKAVYEAYMDAQGRISSEGILYVCNAAGFDLTKRGGEADCKNMIKKMMDLSGYAAGATATDAKECKETFDGIWTVDASGKGKCVDVLGNVLDYRNACTSKIEGGVCEKRFYRAHIQYAVGKNVIKSIFAPKDKTGKKTVLTCQNRKILEKKSEKYILCSAGGKPFTVQFGGISVAKGLLETSYDEVLNNAEILCRIGEAHHGAWIATFDTGSGHGAVCVKDGDNNNTITMRDYIKYGTSACNQMTAWAKEFGGVQAGLVPGRARNTSVVRVARDGAAFLQNLDAVGDENSLIDPNRRRLDLSKIDSASDFLNAAPMRDLCVVSALSTSESSLVNELAPYGFNNYAFARVQISNNEEVINRIREYARTTLNAPNVKVECDTMARRVLSGGMQIPGTSVTLNADRYDVIRCTVDGKKVDMVFTSLSTDAVAELRRLKSGLAGLECITEQGIFDGTNCVMLGEENCKKLATALKEACSDCTLPEWTGETCLLPDSARVTNTDKAIKVIKTTALIGAGVVLTVISEGATAPMLIYAVGATMETVADIRMTWIYQKYVPPAEKCAALSGSAQEKCAVDFINTFAQEMKSYQKEFNPTEQSATDEILSRIFNMIPAESDFWLNFMQDEKLFDPVNCTLVTKKMPWQYVRQIGVALQLIGTVMMVAGKLQKTEQTVTKKIGEHVEKNTYAVSSSWGSGKRNLKIENSLQMVVEDGGGQYSRNSILRGAGFTSLGTAPIGTGPGTVKEATVKILTENVPAFKGLKTEAEVYSKLQTVKSVTGKGYQSVVTFADGSKMAGVFDVITSSKPIYKTFNVGTKITFDFEKAVAPSVAAALALARDGQYLNKTATNGLRIPICFEKPQEFVPGEVTVTIVEPENTEEVPNPSAGGAPAVVPATSHNTTPSNTVTTPGNTVTTPSNTVTTPGNTVTTPSNTVTTPGNTVITPDQPSVGNQQQNNNEELIPGQVSASVTGTETPVITGSPQENPQQPAKNDHIGLKATAITAGALAIGGAVGLLVSKNNKNKSTELNNNVDNSRFAKSNDRTTLGVVDVDWNKLFMTPRSQSFDVSGAKNVLDDNMKQVSNLIDSGAPSPSGFCISVRSRPSQFAGLVKSQYEQNLSRFGGSGRLQYLVNDAELNDSSCTAEQCPMIRTVVRKGACVGL